MQINRTNLNFTSRNATIRFADDLARRVNNVFPRISQTKFESFSFYKKRSYLDIKLKEQSRRMRNLKTSRFQNATHAIQKFLAFIIPVKEAKFGNCAESAQLASIAAKMNGIENCKIARLRDRNGHSFDHEVLLIEDKNPYVIDPWLGFADYIPNALDKYRGVYRQHFDFLQNKEKGMHFVVDKEDIYDKFLRKQMQIDDLTTLAKLYPELILERK